MGYFPGKINKPAKNPQSIFIGPPIQYLFGSKNDLEYNHLLFRREMLHRFLSLLSFFFPDKTSLKIHLSPANKCFRNNKTQSIGSLTYLKISAKN